FLPEGGFDEVALAEELDFVSRAQSSAAARFDFAVHLHLAVLDPDLRFAARAHQAQPLEELIEAELARLGGRGLLVVHSFVPLPEWVVPPPACAPKSVRR